jgi:L-ribulokinase
VAASQSVAGARGGSGRLRRDRALDRSQDGAYPSPEFLAALHPDFSDFAVTRLEHPLPALGTPAGGLTDRAAGWTGLPPGVVVAVGNSDAHVSAPAAQVTEAGQPCW